MNKGQKIFFVSVLCILLVLFIYLLFVSSTEDLQEEKQIDEIDKIMFRLYAANPNPMIYDCKSLDFIKPKNFYGLRQEIMISSYNINNKVGKLEESKSCYTIEYTPDINQTDKDFWVRFASTNPSYVIRNPMTGEPNESIKPAKILRGLVGDFIFDIQRFSSNDNITISSGSKVFFSESLNCEMTIHFSLRFEDELEPYYECYFGGELIHSNLTYEQLGGFVCDEYRIYCGGENDKE